MTNTNRTAAAKISASILALIDQGISPVDALRTICGAETVDQMIDDLYRSLRGGIVEAEKELAVRQTAQAHLRGIPARQNANTIDALYDHLNHLHIARIEVSQ